MEQIAKRVAALSGWRRYALAFVLGGLVTLTLPPVYLFPLNFLIFPIFLWLLSGATRRRAAFAIGWWFGFSFFAFGLYWIGNALLVFSDKFAWLLPFAAAHQPLPGSAKPICSGHYYSHWPGQRASGSAAIF
jgi:apolipoprotein N-acyltransferase